ncbi:MAG: hypothetical protein HYX27_15195 [Acidobacteria bacterium]|nr:hypothetical protein [Acidobacteriota bacterium]
MKTQFLLTISAALLAATAWAQPPAEPESAPPAPPIEEQRQQPQRAPAYQSDGPNFDRALPNQITIPAGSWIKIRVDQPLSSDRNLTGDHFSGTLVQPLVADGFVVAHRGQTIEGRVTDAIKAGRAKGTSRLGLELTEVGLADGQQAHLRTQLVEYNGGTSKGRDAAAVGTTAGIGAAIGAAAAGGFGAGMGAIAGAGAAGIGVLATRGRATEIYPETVVTFRILEPITINTARAAQAFQPVRQTDYEQRQIDRRPAPQPRPYYYGGGFGYNPYFYGGPSLWWGPSYYGNWGPRYYYGGPRVIIRGGGGYRHR